LETVKECVIIYLLNELALKMDGTEAINLYVVNDASAPSLVYLNASFCRRV